MRRRWNDWSTVVTRESWQSCASSRCASESSVGTRSTPKRFAQKGDAGGSTLVGCCDAGKLAKLCEFPLRVGKLRGDTEHSKALREKRKRALRCEACGAGCDF